MATKPVLGINCDLDHDAGTPVARLKMAYVDAVRRAGGIPLLLPPGDPADVGAILERVDGIVLTGGDDVDVRSLGVELHPAAELMDARRQAFDLALARAVLERPVPALGICLGMQELALAAGGELVQDLPSSGMEGLLDHRRGHGVEVVPATRLARILGVRRADVVSHHHQAVARLPGRFRETASAPDGVIEAFEEEGERFLVGVQWHPERAAEAPETQALFRALVDAAAQRSAG